MALALSLATVAAGAPAALAHGGDGDRRDRDDGERTYKVWARVTADATPTAVSLRALGTDRDMRRALDGARDFTAAINADTDIWLVGRARPDRGEDGRRHRSRDGDRHRHRDRDWNNRRHRAVEGTSADLTAGDLVKVKFRAPAGTAVADLPAAARIVDFGPIRACRGDASIRVEMKHGRSRGERHCFPRRGFALR